MENVIERLKIKSTKSPWKRRQRNVIYGTKDKTQTLDLRISSNRKEEKHEGGKLWKQVKENFPVMNDLIFYIEWGLSYI